MRWKWAHSVCWSTDLTIPRPLVHPAQIPHENGRFDPSGAFSFVCRGSQGTLTASRRLIAQSRGRDRPGPAERGSNVVVGRR
jgi:hypothetical protein